MKSMQKIIVLLMVLLTFSAFAEETTANELTGELSLGISSDYNFRGVENHDGAVSQNSLTLNYELPENLGSVFVSYWGNISLSNEGNDYNRFSTTENDYSFGWANTYGDLDLTLGFIHYDFPYADGESRTREVFVSLSHNDVLLTPTVAVYYDMDIADGFYTEFGVSHDFVHNINASQDNTLTVGATVGYAEGDYYEPFYGNGDGKKSSFTDARLNVSYNIPLEQGMSVSIFAEGSMLLDHARNNGNEEDLALVGLSFNYSF